MLDSRVYLLLFVGDEQIIIVAAGLARPHYSTIEMDVMLYHLIGNIAGWETLHVTEYL